MTHDYAAASRCPTLAEVIGMCRAANCEDRHVEHVQIAASQAVVFAKQRDEAEAEVSRLRRVLAESGDFGAVTRSRARAMAALNWRLALR